MTGLYAFDLQPDDFWNIITHSAWHAESVLMAFSPGVANFRFLQPEEDEPFLRQTDHGRIFSPNGELRWRRFEDKIRTVYLGSPPVPDGLEDFSQELKSLHPEYVESMLWGVRTNLEDEWIEQQVPHRFFYPISTTAIPRGRVALVVETWVDAVGIPRFGRYHSLKEIKGGPDA